MVVFWDFELGGILQDSIDELPRRTTAPTVAFPMPNEISPPRMVKMIYKFAEVLGGTTGLKMASSVASLATSAAWNPSASVSGMAVKKRRGVQ